MITPDAAWSIVLSHARPLESISISLTEASGYCLAEDVRADRSLPPADRSAMDGYAVRHDDLQRRPCILRIIGEVAAGSFQRPRVKAGTCVRILTGANIPPGADTVVMVEQTQEHTGLVTIRSSVQSGSNILRQGEDARKGSLLLRRGTRMDTAQVGVCAAVGKATLRVHRLPGVTILCTGSELRSAHDRVQAHEIRNSNGPALCAALADEGLVGTKFISVADRRRTLVATLRRALRCYDVVLCTGGVSAGTYDFVSDAVEAAGATIRFHWLAMKPGKPTLYATAHKNRHIFGLPGNPLSALTAFHEFALPAIRRLAGHSAEACRTAWLLPLADTAESSGGRVRYELARLVNRPNGLAVVAVPSRSSADLVSAGHADGVIMLPPDQTRFAAGQLVAFRPWRPLP